MGFFKASPHSNLILACSRAVHEHTGSNNITVHSGYVQQVVKADPIIGQIKLSKHLSTALQNPSTALQICGNKSSMGGETLQALKDIGVLESDKME